MPPSLNASPQTLRPYQADAADHISDFIAECQAHQSFGRDSRRLYAAPTGTGKGSLQLALLRRHPDAWILTPSLEVLRGFLERCGVSGAELAGADEDGLAAAGLAVRIATPTRLRNAVMRGEATVPRVILYDEGHHAIEGAAVSGTLFAVAPEAVWVAFTATPFRGTPRGTQELRDAWGEPWEILGVPEACREGYWHRPAFRVVGLVDDDQIRVQGGSFVVSSASRLVLSRMEALAQLTADHQDGTPTAVIVPSSECAGSLVERLDVLGVDAHWISARTKARDRAAAYEACRAGSAVLVSVAVIGEGVDFPWLRRLIDARPTMSPVAWMQLLGRITRPGDARPEYICVCRNLERHAYLLDGIVPRQVIAQSQEDFGSPSKRLAARSLGLEPLARFKAIELPLAGGTKGHMYALKTATRDGMIQEFVSLITPEGQAPLHAERINTTREDGTLGWGTWRACALPEGFEGFASSNWRGKASDKQMEWWQREAGRWGLDSGAQGLTKRQFNALPVLKALGVRL